LEGLGEQEEGRKTFQGRSRDLGMSLKEVGEEMVGTWGLRGLGLGIFEGEAVELDRHPLVLPLVLPLALKFPLK